MPGRRPIRIANCAGAAPDPGTMMRDQAKYSNADVLTGDWLAEMNLATNAEATLAGTHNGYEKTAWDAIELSLDIIAEKRIKVVINGGGLRPRAMAERTLELARSKKLDLKVAYVSGDDLYTDIQSILRGEDGMRHLDSANRQVKLAKDTDNFLDDPKKPIVSANAYLGCRAIVKGLEAGADVIICGRVADASPVIGAAWWWHGWKDTDYDRLAGALIAGHLVECSTYATGSNFSGFDRYEILDLLNLSPPIVEISENGDCVVTKADALRGHVTTDIIKCQLLYELQGDIYLNSDVTADISGIKVEQEAENRVKVSGTKGLPPPPTTKLAVFYKGGYQAEHTFYATGYNTQRKFDLHEAQIRAKFDEFGMKFDILEFQRLGVPEENPRSQLASTSGLRVFVQDTDKATVARFMEAWVSLAMQHFSGAHFSLDYRTNAPMAFQAFYPALIKQDKLRESVVFLNPADGAPQSIDAGHPSRYQDVAPRRDYETESPIDLASFGETVVCRLGDVALARSGDKAASINLGLFVQTAEQYEWFKTFLTKDRMRQLMGDDWTDAYLLERVELPKIFAVHFVVYGILGRGVSSCSRLDALGKAFADFIRYKQVEVPKRLFDLK